MNKICLTVTDNLACQSQTCKDPTIGIKSINANKIKIYPNPASETITVEMDGLDNKEYNIQLLNALGQIVINQPELKYSISNAQCSILNVGQLTEGIYLVRITPINQTSGLAYQQKVIISFGGDTN